MIPFSMAWWVLAGLVVFVLLATLLALGACMQAGEADRRIERAREKKMREDGKP